MDSVINPLNNQARRRRDQTQLFSKKHYNKSTVYKVEDEYLTDRVMTQIISYSVHIF